MTRATARRAAFAFAATHLIVCAAGVVEPRAYGLAAGARRRTGGHDWRGGRRSARERRRVAGRGRSRSARGRRGAAAGTAARERLRVLAVVDAAFAAAVADGVLRDRPLRARLRVGAASDVGRAVALITGFDGAPRSRAVLVAASLAGAAAAFALSGRVDAALPS